MFVIFEYSVKVGGFEIIESNLNQEGIIELLETYIHCSIGAGKDSNPAKERDVYRITLEIDLSDDRITVRSNCGNAGLTLGILIDILRRMT
jgi:hypothetical protein